MTERCPTGFDQALLSGHLDLELTQAETQRVRLHLEDCASCRSVFDDLARVREASRTTSFRAPRDDQWDERPRGALSRFARSAGWVLILAWIAALAAFGLWQLATSPEDLWVKLLVFAAVTGPVLLFVSVLIDRLRALRTDPYRRVLK